MLQTGRPYGAGIAFPTVETVGYVHGNPDSLHGFNHEPPESAIANE